MEHLAPSSSLEFAPLSSLTMSWLPRSGFSRQSNPERDQEHEECWLRGGVIYIKVHFSVINTTYPRCVAQLTATQMLEGPH